MLCQVETGAETPLSDTLKLSEAARLECDAARLSRGIESETGWQDIASQARALVCEAATWPAPKRGAWSDHSDFDGCSAALQSCARALDGASLRTGLGGEDARIAGLWAAAAFALGGNFPSASVVLKRTFPRLRARSASQTRPWPAGVAALVAAFSPSLASLVTSHSPFAARVLDGGLEADESELLALMDEETAVSHPDLHLIARAAWQGARELSTHNALCQQGGALARSPWKDVLSARVPLLLPPQKVALSRGFLAREENALAALPPGTGKTWLGELFLFERLAACIETGETPKAPIAVFLVPYVALGRGVVAALRGHARDTGVEVIAWLGSETDDATLPDAPAIIIATPERFDGAWRSDPQLSARLAGVVVDEAHTATDGARGARLETLVARLKLAGVRMLLLSAAAPETAGLGEWIGAPELLRLKLNWTPTARRLAFWRQDGHLEWWAEIAGKGLEPLGEVALAWPRRDLRGGESFVTMQKQEGALYENVAALARSRFDVHGGAVLCLCATRRGARHLARALSRVFPLSSEPTGARARAISLIETRYRTHLPLARLLKHGVAWHSAALPSDLRSLVEEAVRENEIVALAATRTLAEGIDLPFNQTVLADWLSWSDGAWAPMGSGLFRNIAGRCGRAGAFTEGDTLLFDNPLGPSQFCASDVRHLVQRAQFLGKAFDESKIALGEPRAALQEAEGALDNGNTALQKAKAAPDSSNPALPKTAPATRAAWESGATALLAWAGSLSEQDIARALFPVDGDAQGLEAALASTFAAWLSGDWARVDSEGTWTITSRGLALARCDLCGQTATRLLDALASLPRHAPKTSEDAAKINAQLWQSLEGAPEADDASALWAVRSKFVVRAADLVAVSRDWLEGVSTARTFVALPRVTGAADFPGQAALCAWLDGEDGSGTLLDAADASWMAPYDRFSDWTRAALGTFSPRLWNAASHLAPLVGSRPDLKTWDWNGFAARFSAGVPSDFALAALRSGVPGGREIAAVWGRHWPFPSVRGDELGLSPLARDDEDARERAEAAYSAALGEAGGAHCAAGLGVRALRDFLWARAGATK